MKLERYKAGAETPLRAKLRMMGIPEPEFMSRKDYDARFYPTWEWLPFHKLRYVERRALWREYNVTVERLLKGEKR